MKCLVLLLVVAVCQGGIVRDRRLYMRTSVPEIEKVRDVLYKDQLIPSQQQLQDESPVVEIQQIDQRSPIFRNERLQNNRISHSQQRLQQSLRKQRSQILQSFRQKDRSPFFLTQQQKDRSPLFQIQQQKEQSPLFQIKQQKEQSPLFRSQQQKEQSLLFRSQQQKEQSPLFRSQQQKEQSPLFRSQQQKEQSPLFRSQQQKEQSPIFGSKTLKQSLLQSQLLKEQPFIQERIESSTPWIMGCTKPKTFLNYISTFNTKPWNQLTKWNTDAFDFKSFGDLMQFPGGEFLQEEIDKFLQNMPFQKRQPLDVNLEYRNLPWDTALPKEMENIEDVRDVLPFIAEKLEKMVPLYMETIDDPSTVALLVTRDLVKLVLHGRMKCPAVSWQKYFIENVKEQLDQVTNENQHKLQENFRMLLPQVLPVEPEMMDQLVYMFTQDVQERIYKDVVQYIHGVAFKDVAILSHELYREVKLVLEESWNNDLPMFMERLVAIVTDVITKHNTCPQEVHYNQESKMVCWDFSNGFAEREFARIHSRVMNIINHVLYSTCTSEECTQYSTRMNEIVEKIIEQYIGTVVQYVPVCLTPTCLDPPDCLLSKYQTGEPGQMEFLKTIKTMQTKPIDALWNNVKQEPISVWNKFEQEPLSTWNKFNKVDRL